MDGLVRKVIGDGGPAGYGGPVGYGPGASAQDEVGAFGAYGQDDGLGDSAFGQDDGAFGGADDGGRVGFDGGFGDG